MENNVYRTIKNVIWGTAVAVSIGMSAYCGFDYLKEKNVNYPARVQADIQKAERMSELDAQRNERLQTLLSTPEYQNYLQQRKEFTKELVVSERVRDIEVFERIVDAAFGDNGNQK